MFRLAVPHFLLAGEFAPAVFRDGMWGILFARGPVRNRRPPGGQAGNVNEPLNPPWLPIDRLDDIPRAHVIDRVKFRNMQRLDAPGAVNDMGNVLQGGAKALRVTDGADAHVELWQVRLNETLVAGGPEQHRRGDAARAKAVQNVAADESARACKENLH